MTPKAFDNVVLTDSWVLGWRHEDDLLEIAVEASLTSDHPSYEPPKQNEWTCYKRGRVLFEGVRELRGLLDQDAVSPSTSSDGSKDYGNIYLLVSVEGGFNIAGDFGDVLVLGGSVRLELD